MPNLRLRRVPRIIARATSGGKGPTNAVDGLPNFPYTVRQMARTESTGSFEQLVLAAILSLDDDAYGVSIHAKVERLVRPKSVSLGAVYVTLDRLEDKGMICSRLSEPTAERGGRAKRCYRLEALGEHALRESAVTAKRIWDSIAETWGKDWARQW
jgi:PadR family transcriptional regulator PadR